MNRKCFLKCVHNSHEPILLPHKEEVVIGRSLQTGIKDSRCSRKQVSLVANNFTCNVRIKQTGDNASAVNGESLWKNNRHILNHGDYIEFLRGQYKHSIEFEPPPEVSNTSDNKRKEIIPDSIESLNPPREKKQKIDSSSSSRDQTSEFAYNMDVCEKNTWENVENGKVWIFTSKGTEHKEKIAAYDFDWTIVGTKSGRVFPKDCNDWSILYPEIPGKLKELLGKGFKLVIFSNQNGLGNGKVKIEEFKTKVERVVTRLGVPMQVYACTGPSKFRKPMTGMWEILVEKKNGGLPIDISSSLYCGDAAGRPKDWAFKKKKDFSCSDRLFALNVGLQFYTPEEHFQCSRPHSFSLPEFQPKLLPSNLPECDPASAKLISTTQELAILVGSPGSGKSFIAHKKLIPAGYKHASNDLHKTVQKCLDIVRSSLASGHSVVVDNTNPDAQSRARFIAEARKNGVPCRCLVMATSLQHARHNNKFREFMDPNHAQVSEMVFQVYKTKYQEPELKEGFAEIIKVNFIPQFTDLKLKSLYEMFLLDK